MSDAQVQGVCVELVEFQHGQVGIEVVGVVFSLFLNVFLEEWKVIGIVAEKLQVISVVDEKLSNFTHRSILFNISGIVIVPSMVLMIFDIVSDEIVRGTGRKRNFCRSE